MSKAKENNDEDLIFHKLKENVCKQNIMYYEQGEDGVFRYQVDHVYNRWLSP